MMYKYQITGKLFSEIKNGISEHSAMTITEDILAVDPHQAAAKFIEIYPDYIIWLIQEDYIIWLIRVMGESK